MALVHVQRMILFVNVSQTVIGHLKIVIWDVTWV
jgi:hypothetical protein